MATTAETLRRTNEVPGTRAKLKGLNTSAFKVREVLNLIRGENVNRANEILQFCERGPAVPVQKLLNSAIANAENNDQLDRNELFVAACFADEGVTMKRMKPGARGRAGKIRKRSSHITIVVARLPEDKLERLRTVEAATAGSRRSRVAGSRANRTAASKAADSAVISEAEEEETIEAPEIEEATSEVSIDEVATDNTVAEEETVDAASDETTAIEEDK